MSDRRGLRGGIVWALVAFQPEAPFELEGTLYETARDVIDAVGDQRLPKRLTIEMRLRPVVILQDRPRGAIPEYAALKLTRLTKIGKAIRQQVRDGQAPAYVHLRESERYGLTHENAVDLTSLVRIHRSAIASAPVGHLTDDELETVGRRLATYLDIDLEPAIAEGVAKRWAKLVAAQRRGEACS